MTARLDELWELYDDLILGKTDGNIDTTREDIETEAIGQAASGLISAASLLGFRNSWDPNQDEWPCIGGPMAGAMLPLRDAYRRIRVDGAKGGEYRRTQVDLGRWAYLWVER